MGVGGLGFGVYGLRFRVWGSGDLASRLIRVAIWLIGVISILTKPP